jgi:hypothetical protein
MMASPSVAPAHCLGLLVRVVGEYFDHYLGHTARRNGLVPVDEFFRPEKLALVLVRFHKQQRNRQQLSVWPPGGPPPFPHLTGIVFGPRQLQCFPRSFTLLAACRLAGKDGVSCTSPDRRNADWIDYIVVRVASGIVKKVKVRRRGAPRVVPSACDRCRANSFFIHALLSKRCMACRCDAVAGDAQASAVLLNAAPPRTRAPCR